MNIPAGKVAVLDSVGAAMRMWRGRIQLGAAAGLIGAAAMTAVALVSMRLAGNPSLAMLAMTASSILAAYVYSVFLISDLHGPAALRDRLPADGARVWAALAILTFFLFIVFVVAAIPGLVLLVTALGPYMNDLQAAGQDQAAMLPVVERFAQENIGLLFGMMLVYGVILLLLTSRLYAAAPATVHAGRILSFETWSWTKNNMLRIAAARLMLLIPASILVFAAQALLGGALGMNVMDPVSLQNTANANPALYSLVVFVGHAVNFILYRGLEAALSTQIYKALKPPA